MFTILLLLITVGAFAFRVPRLAQRPMHTDEAVHAVKLGILLDEGVYEYNPREYHGPTLYYFSLPFVWLSGARSFTDMGSEIPMRVVPVMFGAGLVLLLLLTADGLGRPATIWAGVLTAVSPAMVFYSRYYVQEMLLVFFTFGAIAAGWRYTRSKRLGWALLSGVCVGFMYATKETCVIAYGCMFAAGVLTAAWMKHTHQSRQTSEHESETPPSEEEAADKTHASKERPFSPWHLSAAIIAALVIGILCFTVAFTRPRAILDSVLTYVQYAQRASTGDSSTSGAGLHNHPWHYYLQMLLFAKYGAGPWWSEAFIVILALVGITESVRRRGLQQLGQRNGTIAVFCRFLAIYTIMMTVVYSAIPYKTPWCMLSFLHGMILMAGVGATVLFRRLPNKPLRVVAGVVLAAGIFHLCMEAYRGSYVFHSDSRNPYVYGHTSTDLLRLVDRIEQIAEVHPEGHDMLVKVMVSGSDYWPLPWYLRRFTRVGYWNHVPDQPDAPLIIASPDLEPSIDTHLRQAYQKEYFGLRPAVLLLTYIRSDLWDQFIERRR